MMMRKELGVQSQQIELYNIYERLSTTYILVCCCWHLFWYSSCLSVREKEREKRVRVFVLGVWVVSTCAWACRLALPACEPSADCAFIYLFYIFVLCVSSQGKEEDEKKKNVLHNRTFSTPFSESPTNGQTSRKRVGNGLEDFSFYRRVASFFGFEFDWIW